MISKKAVSIIVVALMLSMPFISTVGRVDIAEKETTESVAGKQYTGSPIQSNITESILPDNTDIEETYKPEYGSMDDGSMLYDDGRTWWLFTPTSENEATLLGAWFKDRTQTDLVLPQKVTENAYVDSVAEIKMEAKQNLAKYAIMEIALRMSDTNETVTRYLNIQIASDGPETIESDATDLPDEPVSSEMPTGVMAASVSTLRIKGLETCRIVSTYYLTESYETVYFEKPKTDCYVLIPDDLKEKNGLGTEYTVTAVGDSAFIQSENMFIKFINGGGPGYIIDKWSKGIYFHSLSIPSTVKIIGDGAFGGISLFKKLRSIDFGANSELEYIGKGGISAGIRNMYKEKIEYQTEEVTSYIGKSDFSDITGKPIAKLPYGKEVEITLRSVNPFNMIAYGYYSGLDFDNDSLGYVVDHDVEGTIISVDVDTGLYPDARYIAFLYDTFQLNLPGESSLFMVFEIGEPTDVETMTSYEAKDDYSDYGKTCGFIQGNSTFTITLKADKEISQGDVRYYFSNGNDDGPIMKYAVPDGTGKTLEATIDTSVYDANTLHIGLKQELVSGEYFFKYMRFAILGNDMDERPMYTETVLPKTIKYIDKYGLAGTQKLIIEEGSALEYIGPYAFSCLNPMFPVQFPKTVSNLGTSRVQIPSNHSEYVTAFNPEAKISFESGGRYSVTDGNLMDGDVLIRYLGDAEEYTFPAYVRSVANCAFENNDTIRTISIPLDLRFGVLPFTGVRFDEILFDEEITEIPSYFFARCGMTKVTIPSNIEKIGERAFFDCNKLGSVEFENDSRITEIDEFAFVHCKSLTQVKFGSHMDGYDCHIGDWAFFYCNYLERVILDDDFVLSYIGNGAFAKATSSGQNTIKATSFNTDNGILIPYETTFVGDCAFSSSSSYSDVNHGGNMTNLYMPNTYRLMYFPSPQNGNNFKISFEKGPDGTAVVNSLGIAAFNISGCTTVDLSNCNMLTSIERNCFNADSLKTLIFPTDGRLQSCFGFARGKETIDSVEIPRTVTDFGNMSCAKNISFEENSELVNFKGCSKTANVDLSNCGRLEYAKLLGNLTLPAGIYSMDAGESYTLTNAADVIANGDSACISENTIAINKNIIGAYPITGSNDIFTVEDGCLIYTNGATKLVAGTSSPETVSVTIGPDSPANGIMKGAFSGSKLETLILDKNDLKIGPGIFSGNKTIRDIYVLCDSETFTVDPQAFSGTVGDMHLYAIDPGNDLTGAFEPYGTISKGLLVNGKYVFMPKTIGKVEVTCSLAEETDDSVTLDVSMTKGYAVCDVDFTSDNASVTTSGSKRIVIGYDSGSMILISGKLKDRTVGDMVEVTFDPAGGKLSGPGIVKIPKGMSTIDSDIPTVTYSNHTLKGWSVDGGDYDGDSPLMENMTLKAVWVLRPAIITICTDAGTVTLDGKKVTSVDTEGKSEVTLVFSKMRGYEPLSWRYSDGERVFTSPIDRPLVLADLSNDLTVTVDYRYYSTSTKVISLTNRGMPTMEEAPSTVLSWIAGGIIDRSTEHWTGHTSIPLIVDEYVYLRIGDKLIKVESDTGYIVKSVDSVSTKAYYHSLSYANGCIYDYLTGKTYDLDLNEREPFSGSEMDFPYYYGYSAYENGYAYRAYAEGTERGILAKCIDKNSEDYGKTARCPLPRLSKMFLDDGWISIYNGTLFTSGYTTGLFGAVATTGNSVMAYVKVNGLEFEEPKYYDLGASMWVSEFVSANGYGFVSCSGLLHVFKMNDDGSLGDLLGYTSLDCGHGSITVDISYATEENGFLTYVYGLPYDQVGRPSMWIAEGYMSPSGYVLKSYPITHIIGTYCSQAIRAGLHGEMIYYNDSCWTHCVVTPDNNWFYIFLDNGKTAKWVRCNGSSPYDAMSSLGSANLSIGDDGITSVFDQEGGWNLFALTGGTVDKFNKYEWTKISDPKDESIGRCHYFVVTRNDKVERGVWYYGADASEYIFKDNIGDRSIIGVTLSSDSGEMKVAVEGISIEGTDNELLIGSKLSLTPIIRPANATDKFLYWTTSDKSIAVVDDLGVVTGVSAGNAIITAITHDGGFSSSYTVKVVSSKTEATETVETSNPDGSITVTTGSVTNNSDGSTVIRKSESTSIGGSVVTVRNTSETKSPDGSVTVETTTIEYAGNGMTISSGRTSITAERGILHSDVSGLSLMSSAVDRNTLTEIQRERVGNANLYDIVLMSGNAGLTEFDDRLMVTIENAVTRGTSPDTVKVWHIGEDGSMEEMDFKFETSTGTVSFYTDHLSVYAVSFEEPKNYVLTVTSVVAVIAAAILASAFYRPRRD